ncbi:hypothetical protein AQUCO_00900976v1 [Aquilegia coerulea]|uniref:Uncharacterized protein n=1 Tax=Aquilegia coerulea TaxID=218851 RepID=A0A2G5EGE2_AQUCA|nr:hypothetical protein AQUCO_00900976v1 [Aquilegia coerulea]
MALISQSNQVCSSSLLSDRNHGRSKAQMCLKKIIDFISSNGSLKNIELESSHHQVEVIHKQDEEEEEMKVLSYGKRGFDIDLNLRLGPWLELENENNGFSACSGIGVGVGVVNNNNCSSSVDFGYVGGGGDVSTVDKSSEGECDPKHVLEQEEEMVVVVEEEEVETKELSEITNLQVQISSEIENNKETEVKQEEDNEIKAENQVKVLRKSEGYLDLLVEAARLISGNFEEEEEEEEEEEIIYHEKKKPMSRRNGRLNKPQKKEETQMKMKELVGLEAKKVNEEEWMLDCYGEFEDISPIVRSKRGRNQVLPHKYRDSVLEPWKRLTTTTTTTKQRSSRVKQRTK